MFKRIFNYQSLNPFNLAHLISIDTDSLIISSLLSFMSLMKQSII